MTSELFKCDSCAKCFEALGRLNRHLKVHSKPYRCKQCERGFALSADLNRHIRSRHRLGTTEHICPVKSCPFTTIRKDNLKQHLDKIHDWKRQPAEIGATTGGNVQKHLGGDMSSQHQSVHTEQAMIVPDKERQSYLGLYEALASGNTSLVQRYLDEGLNIDHIAHINKSLLHCAARAGQSSMVQYLIKNGASISVVNSSGQRLESPVHQAILSGNPETVECLLRAGYTQEDSIGLPRHLAQCGSIRILQLCLTHVVDMVDPYFNYQILDAAAKTGQVSVVRALLVSQRNTLRHEIISPTTATTDVGMLPTELQVPWAPQAQRVDFFNPLHNAAARGHTEIVQILLNNSFNFHLVGRKGKTPLHLAAREGHASIVQLLLGLATTDINVPDDRGHTPLHLAARGGCATVVQILLGNPTIKPLCFNQLGATPLHVSALYGHWDIAQMLLDHEESIPDKPKQILIKAKDQLIPSEIMSKIFKTCDFQDINIRQFRYETNMNGEGLLHLAVRMGDCDLLKVLLDHPNINRKIGARENIDSPLVLAAQLNELEAAALLLRHEDIDMEISQHNPPHMTPLQIARSKGYDDMVELLLARGARDDNVQQADANTPP